MKPVGIIGLAALFLVSLTTAPAWARQEKQNEEKDKEKAHAKAGKQQPKEKEAAPPAKPERPTNQRQPRWRTVWTRRKTKPLPSTTWAAEPLIFQFCRSGKD